MSRRRSYHQLCGLSWALDVVGERWTLLIIRELLISPCRHQEILGGLPGISGNLLADRLKMLTAQGLVTQRPAIDDGRGKVYALTSRGEELRPAVMTLAHWGLGCAADNESDFIRPSWGFLALQAMVDDSRVSQLDESYEFRVADEVFHLSCSGGRVMAARGCVRKPAMIVHTNAETFVLIGSRRLAPMEALASGVLVMEGDHEAMQRCLHLLHLDDALEVFK